jgi:hypothetical protein
MSDARDDVYRLAALLADLDRVINPLPRGPVGGFLVEPSIPPPLPPVAGPGEGTPPHGRRQATTRAGTVPVRAPAPAPRTLAGLPRGAPRSEADVASAPEPSGSTPEARRLEQAWMEADEVSLPLEGTRGPFEGRSAPEPLAPLRVRDPPAAEPRALGPEPAPSPGVEREPSPAIATRAPAPSISESEPAPAPPTQALLDVISRRLADVGLGRLPPPPRRVAGPAQGDPERLAAHPRAADAAAGGSLGVDPGAPPAAARAPRLPEAAVEDRRRPIPGPRGEESPVPPSADAPARLAETGLVRLPPPAPRAAEPPSELLAAEPPEPSRTRIPAPRPRRHAPRAPGRGRSRVERDRVEISAPAIRLPGEVARSRPRLPPVTPPREPGGSGRWPTAPAPEEAPSRPPAPAFEGARPVAAGPEDPTPEGAPPVRAGRSRWWWGPLRRIVVLHAREAEAIARAEHDVHRRFQDRARWRIR